MRQRHEEQIAANDDGNDQYRKDGDLHRAADHLPCCPFFFSSSTHSANDAAKIHAGKPNTNRPRKSMKSVIWGPLPIGGRWSHSAPSSNKRTRHARAGSALTRECPPPARRH